MAEKLMEKYRKLPQQVKASFWFVVCGFLPEGNFPFDDTDFFQTVIHIGLWSVQRI